MGLDCSHGAFHGSYSSFNRFRQAVCRAVGGVFPHFDEADREYLQNALGVAEINPGFWYVPDEVTREMWPGLYAFLEHSDCDGVLSPEECMRVADDLEKLLPGIDRQGENFGHIAAQGGFGKVARAFIAGCRLAATKNENLEFY